MVDRNLMELFESLRDDYKQLSLVYNEEELDEEIGVIEGELSEGDVWDDVERARGLSKRLSKLKNARDTLDNIRNGLEEIEVAISLLEEDEDEGLYEEALSKGEKLRSELNKKLLLSAFTGEYDEGPAIVTIKPGAGGTESQDWAEMLFRMYTRWFELSEFSFKVIDYQSADKAGIKEVTMLVEGDYAYGYLSAEAGVHRLVRISPYDANKKRHTSFASVFVQPYIEEDVEVEIDENELRIDTFHSSGAGGQHVNVTDSAVRITHIPTGIVVSCQDERSQRRNRDVAMQVLRSRLYQYYKEKEEEKIDSLHDKKSVDFGSQIRSYVLHPYKLVKDHRTDYETSQVENVLDGDLDEIINDYIVKIKAHDEKENQ